MMTVLVFSLLFGLVLGQRFNVLVLIPVIPVVLIVALAAGIARADGVWLIVTMAALAATGVQIGYLAGTAVRVMIVAMYAGRRSQSLQIQAPWQRLGH